MGQMQFPLTEPFTGTIAATPVVVNMSRYRAPCGVTLIPGSGNTSLCEYSLTPNAADPTVTANWRPWPAGTVSVATTDTLLGPVQALRFTRVSGASSDTYEVVATV